MRRATRSGPGARSCRRPAAAQRLPDQRREHRGWRPDIRRVIAALAERDAGADQRLAQLAARRHPEAAVVEIGAGALLGPEHLVPGRLVDDAGDDLTVAFEADRDREMRD